MGNPDLLLALARCTFLTCAEKQFFAENLDNLESLTVLSIEDISISVGRVVHTRCWKPEILGELVLRDLEIMDKFDIHWVPINSSGYPPLLRELHDSPFVLFWRGILPDPERPLIAIVGTRSPTGDGSLEAARLGRDFAEAGIPVISGLASGIDAWAHRGNVEGGAKSVAVLACGLDQIYPRSNRYLASALLEGGGCLMGEYPPLESPLRYRFPQRNRIISGLARAVIVVEAPEKSGALITADFALEQGRDLYVDKNTLDNCRSAGVRKLFEQGAPAVSSAAEILEEWGYAGDALNGRIAGGSAKSGGSAKAGMSISASIGRQLAFDFRNELALRQRKG